ncbi:MAG: hypothetical protein NVS1B16_10110 [Pseudarthrobacter sp.]
MTALEKYGHHQPGCAIGHPHEKWAWASDDRNELCDCGLARAIETQRLTEERWAIYQENVDETNRALDAAGLHVGSSDLATLVHQLIRDADNGRVREKKARAEALEAAAKAADRWAYSSFNTTNDAREDTARDIAEAIRELKG